MDIKAKIEEVAGKIQNDKEFASKFQADPVKAVEGVIGIDLPDDQVNMIIETVRKKAAAGGIMNKLSGIIGGGKA